MLEARLLDLPYLLANELPALHVAAQLGERIGRDRLALGRAHVFQALRRLLELGIEVANAEPRQGRLDAVDDSGLLANEGLALAVGALGIFLRQGRDRRPSCSAPARRAASQETRVSSCSVSSRSVLARRCSRDTATLAA